MARLEKHVQAGIMRDLRAIGCHVSNLSQPRATKQTPGLPDLFVMHPAVGGFWVEVKAARGRLQDSQVEWHADAARCSVPVVVARCTGDVVDAFPSLIAQP